MNLIHFHRLLIGTGVVFCLGYGTWEIARSFRVGGGPPSLIVGAVFLLLGILLLVYLLRLRSFVDYEE